MARVQLEIDRLIDEGLTRYGLGDLDGALAAWEQALALDPQQERANGYIDYVRSNYELLASEVSGHIEAPAFAIVEEDSGDPGYQIEVMTGEIAAATPAPRIRESMDGWPIEEERDLGAMGSRELTFELDIDDPDDGAPIGLESYPPRPPAQSISFEDATSEYAGGPTRPNLPDRTEDSVSQEFRIEVTPTPGFDAEFTPGFDSAADLQTPLGFATQVTDVRPRELGFVQPVASPADHRSASASATDLKMSLRTPEDPEPPPAAHAGQSEPPAEPPPADDLLLDMSGELPYEIDSPTTERPPGLAFDPRRVEERTRMKPGMTRDLPGATRKPAGGEPLRRPETRDFDTPTERKPLRPTTTSESLIPPRLRDLSEPTTSRMPRPPSKPSTETPPLARPPSRPAPPLVSIPLGPAPLVTAPTRDLGLRQTQPAPGGGLLPGAEGDPPPPSAIQVLQRAATLPSPIDPTRNDLVLPFDPIGARSEQILDAIDDEAPADESREDRTRRRITALFERAIDWNKAGELDRAVAAIDLALSEDPNSALAQKLIHRHRETMMNVFQAFLGDLERTPVLARPLHELAAAPISSRAAFLLSRVDGLLSIDEILDVSGMPRLEAYRYLCQLFLRGILR